MVQLFGTMEYIFFLGNTPALSAVEIHNYFLRNNLDVEFDLKFLPHFLLVKSKEVLDTSKILSSLGGTPQIAKIITSIDTINSNDLIEISDLKTLLDYEGKPILSLSFQNFSNSLPHIKNSREIRTLGIQIKKTLGLKGFRLVVPQNGTVLTTAQYFNSNIPIKGVGIILLQVGVKELFLAQLSAVQDIDFYTRRDRERPAVDPGKGMLPVKLAQIYLNLTQSKNGDTIYDPFCGAGTIVSEALLQDFNIIATDISPKQVDRTKENAKWLIDTFSNKIKNKEIPRIFEHDIEKKNTEIALNSIDAVVTEGWLGPALSNRPSSFEIEKVFVRTQGLLNALLENTHGLLKTGGHVVISLPAFRMEKRLIRAPFLQEELRRFLSKNYVMDPLIPNEWNHLIFRDSQQGMILYGRPDAVVLRDIVRFKKVS